MIRLMAIGRLSVLYFQIVILFFLIDGNIVSVVE